MPELEKMVEKTRSKNAGPFWLTIDIFCGSAARFDHVRSHLDNKVVSELLGTPIADMKRFDIPSLEVIKISIPRPTIQGTRHDRDMHGAQWANLVSEMQLPALDQPAE